MAIPLPAVYEGDVVTLSNLEMTNSPDDTPKSQEPSPVAIVAHEMGAPLSALQLRLYLLRKNPEQLAEHLDKLDIIAARLDTLLQDLLDASRFEMGAFVLNRQNVPLKTLVMRVIDLLHLEAEQKNITLIAKLQPASLTVWADPDRIVQVLTNLVANAIHYTPDGGQVTIQTAAEYERSAVLLQVGDTGVGIAPEHIPHLFQPFFRIDNSKKGTGLGLPIAKQIVELHGSELFVESEVGVGTTFSFRLRLADEQGV
jgi:signal transduction histidine kinase